jgi:hypothetical protein
MPGSQLYILQAERCGNSHPVYATFTKCKARCAFVEVENQNSKWMNYRDFHGTINNQLSQIFFVNTAYSIAGSAQLPYRSTLLIATDFVEGVRAARLNLFCKSLQV